MRSRSWLWVIGSCLLITAVLAVFKVRQIQQAIAYGESFGEPMEVVELATVTAAQWQQRVAVTAEVKAPQVVELSNELGGRVVEVGFKSGATVTQGQLLVRLDTSEEQAQLAAANADARLASLALARNQQLVKTGVASEETRDQSIARYNAAVAAEDRLKAIINKKTMRAPFAAKAGIFQLEPGQYLQANTLITRLVGQSDLVWLDFNLPQQQATLHIGDTVYTSGSQFAGEAFPATVIARDSRVNPRSGNLLYRAVADNTQGKFYPGTVVSVTVAVGEPQLVNRIPMNAIRYDAFGPNVYVLVPAEKGAVAAERAVKRRVTLGQEQDQQVVVLSGLASNERIAGNGAFKLRDGLLVNAVVAKPVTVSSEVSATKADAEPNNTTVPVASE